MQASSSGGARSKVVECESVFTSVACNRVAHAAAWGRNGLVAYGAHNVIALYDPVEFRIVETLRGHKGRVNAVCWVPSAEVGGWRSPESELVSGASDNLLVVWQRSEEKGWAPSSVLQGHTDAVTSVSVLVDPAGSLWVASTSSDRTVRVWKRTKHEWAAVQTIEFGVRMMECISMTNIPNTDIIMMAVGGVEPPIHLFVGRADKFHKLLSLQGHEDWIRSLSFVETDSGDVLLASSSQDNYIRLWRIARYAGLQGNQTAKTISRLGDEVEQLRGQKFCLAKGAYYFVALESVLHGHEDWVYSVCWQPALDIQGKKHQPMCLLSASMDRTMHIWRPERETGVWLDDVRVGEMGGNTLGFYGGLFGPTGTQILAHGYNGAFHLWEKEASEGDTTSETWRPRVTVSGHFGSVLDITWDPSYQYLISISKDQTSRLFAPWRRGGDVVTWHEIARPQIHGYDMSCLTFVLGTEHRYVSGADEKVLRVFDAPRTFVSTLAAISGIVSQIPAESRPLGANVPPLGLTNKPFTEQDKPDQDIGDSFRSEAVAQPIVFYEPPFEEHLLQSTLWPETQKLYGHGDNIVCVACSRSGSLIASACKGRQMNQCDILLWDTTNWKRKPPLLSHTLTVTQLSFSSDDSMLLSVSRDRSFSVFSIPDGKLIAKVKAHDRIIWAGDWSPDSSLIATGSRDKKVKFWHRTTPRDGGSEGWEVDSVITLKAGVTAVAFLPTPGNPKAWKYLVAIGQENGLISLWAAAHTEGAPQKWTSVYSVPPTMSHVDVVRRLRWRKAPTKRSTDGGASEEEPVERWELASCGADHALRLLSFAFQ